MMEKIKSFFAKPLLRVPLISLGMGVFLQIFQYLFNQYLQRVNAIDVNNANITVEMLHSVIVLSNGILTILSVGLILWAGFAYLKGITRKQAAQSAGIVVAYGALLFVLRQWLFGWDMVTVYNVLHIPLNVYTSPFAMIVTQEPVLSSVVANTIFSILGILLPLVFVAFARPIKAKKT